MIYFCIPTRDEAPTIGLVLWKIRRLLEDTPREYQLLVGDDASTDATAEVLAPYLKVLPLTVFRSDRPLGYAATVERLLREALKQSDRHKRDAAILLPADFSVDLATLPEFLKRLDSGADVVIGETDQIGETDRWRRQVRRWAGRLLGRSVRISGVRDNVSGYAAYRLVALRNAFRDRTGSWLHAEGWAANAELHAWAAAGARRVEVVPATERHDRRERSSRHEPWTRAKALWAARKVLVAPPLAPPGNPADRSPRATAAKEAA